MKKFDQVITVEVSVNSIAEHLLSVIDPQFKHADMLAESIIGTSLEKGTLGYLYNSLNGYGNDINFKKGDKVICTETTLTHIPKDGALVQEWVKIGECEVDEVDIYRSDKLKVRYNKVNKQGESYIDDKWVDHNRCQMIPPVLEEILMPVVE